MEYEFHPLSNLLPMMSDQEYQNLKRDIESKGLEHPIVLFQGKILDGRNRYTACIDCGREPLYVTYMGSDPQGYVLSVNLHRRQLTNNQRVVIGERIANMPEGRNWDNSANLQSYISIEQAANLLGTSARNIHKLRDMKKTATPELVALVEAPGSKVSLDAACLVATKSKEEQLEILAEGPKAVKKAAAEIRNPPLPQEKRIAEDSPWAVSNLKASVFGYIKAIRNSASSDTTSIEALEEIIAKCQQLKSEIQKSGDHHG